MFRLNGRQPAQALQHLSKTHQGGFGPLDRNASRDLLLSSVVMALDVPVPRACVGETCMGDRWISLQLNRYCAALRPDQRAAKGTERGTLHARRLGTVVSLIDGQEVRGSLERADRCDRHPGSLQRRRWTGKRYEDKKVVATLDKQGSGPVVAAGGGSASLGVAVRKLAG